ncbi:unnamed protein product [Euphydryas editha]|uniref:Uncharacterized protein n=1 Tax=Euphydryas editha TaxID=104508 RepID=A0AAU9UY13_EUPED|nr:unnamed protein product [Euphydryas editha]
MSSARGGRALIRTARAGGPRVSTERRAASRRRAAAPHRPAPRSPPHCLRRCSLAPRPPVTPAAPAAPPRPHLVPHTTRHHLRLLPLPLSKKKVN